MPENTVSASELASQYIAQVSSDLESNTKEQDRLREEIGALEAQLAALQRDHTVLVNVQLALGGPAAPAEPTAGAGAGSTAPSRRKPAAKSAAGKQARARKSPTGPGRTTARKPAAKRSKAEDTAAKTAKPTLVELVRSHLAQQSEPRSAAEVTTALGETHPERATKATVVRTTLEGLVAKNLAQRSKQGSSVFYTSSDAQEQSTQGEKTQSSPAE
ncbi:BlaI/MecI/CopY family transcriptional regulator [Streptomyces sp. NPDC004561]